MYNNNVFLRAPDEYIRDIDIVENAIISAATFLQIQTNEPFEKCKEFIKKQIAAGGKYELKPVTLHGLLRQKNKDRKKTSMSIDSILNKIKENDAVLAPNFVIYDSFKSNPSLLSEYTVEERSNRVSIKAKGIEAGQMKNELLAATCDQEEYKIKIHINAISGSFMTPHNPIYNRSGHSTLTSNTRTMVGYSNASTERFVAGNRHYWSKNIVIENITTVVLNTDYIKLNQIIDKYNLYIPNVDDVMYAIKRCTKFYWNNESSDKEILNHVSKLSGIQRASFIYTGDFYHLAKFNDELIRTILNALATPTTLNYDLDPDYYVKNVISGIQNLSGIICSDFMRGNTIKELKQKDYNNYVKYAATIKYLEETVYKYSDLFITLFTTDNLPPSIYNFPSSIRRAVVGSDTDSTMYTVQNWVEWYFGKLSFGPEEDRIANVVSYLNNQVTANLLVTMSKQIGVDNSHLYILEMKNEFWFSFYIRTNIVKHYITQNYSREGSVFEKPINEIKGVGFLDSKKPIEIANGLSKEVDNILLEILKTGNFEIHPVFYRIANLEHVIYNSLENGSVEFLQGANISPFNAYKKPMSSAYMHYDLWINVFQNKYGEISPPPYRAIKISTCIDNPKKFRLWLETLDPVIKEPLIEWIKKKNTEELGTILFPYDLFESGIPKELISLIDKRKIVSELVSSFYLLLESFGFYIRNKHNTMLLSDNLAYTPKYGLPGGMAYNMISISS